MENAAISTPKPPLRRPGVLRFSTVHLLVALILLTVAAPFIEVMPSGRYIEPILTTLVLFLAVLSVGGNRKTLLIAILLVIPAISGHWFYNLHRDFLSPEVHLVAQLIFLGYIVGHLLRFILRAPRVNAEVLCAGISGYILLAMSWVVAYMLVAGAVSQAFSFTAGPPAMEGFTAFYFSLSTITTTGYGDIIPVHRVARMLAVLESVTGMFYIAIVISRLVALYSANPAQPASSPQSPADRQ